MRRNKPVDMDYFKYLSKDSILGSSDIQSIFGYKKRSSVQDMMNRGDLPRPDAGDFQRCTMSKRKQESHWKASTVLECVKKLQAKSMLSEEA